MNVCGWLGLPTGILWVFALAWAYYRPPSYLPTGETPDAAIQHLNRLEAAVAQLESQRGTSP